MLYCLFMFALQPDHLLVTTPYSISDKKYNKNMKDGTNPSTAADGRLPPLAVLISVYLFVCILWGLVASHTCMYTKR